MTGDGEALGLRFAQHRQRGFAIDIENLDEASAKRLLPLHFWLAKQASSRSRLCDTEFRGKVSSLLHAARL